MCVRDPICGSWKKGANVLPAPPIMMLSASHGHGNTHTHTLHTHNPVPSPLSGGTPCQEKPRSPGTGSWKSSGKPIHGKPIHNGAVFAPSKDRALLIIQGTVQLCKSVGSLCPAAAFCRSPEGDGDAQSPSCWVQEGSHPACKRGNKSPTCWAHRKLRPEPAPAHIGERVAAPGNDSEDLGMPFSEPTYPHTTCGASKAIIQSYSCRS